MPYTQEQLLEMYRKLPKEVQDAIFSVDTAEIVRQIGEKHKLMIDKIGELADETGLVMLGLTHPSQYIPHLTERVGVSREIAREIAQEVNAKIFAPIREHLKKIHGLTEKETTIPPEPAAPPPPTLPSDLSADLSAEALAKAEASAKAEPPSPPPPAPLVPPVPPIPPTPPSEPKPSFAEATEGKDIFETKTKEEIFRQPPQKKIDPYRESTS